MSVEEVAKKKLMQFVLELSGTELDTLIDKHSRRTRVLEYLPGAQACFAPDDSSMHPWYIEWLAAQWTGKHVHTLRSRPELRAVRGDLDSFIHKLRWRSILAGEDGGEVVKIKRPVTMCNQVVAPELEAWCSLFRKNILKAAEVGSKTGTVFNTSKLYAWALGG